jgi:predicted ATPase
MPGKYDAVRLFVERARAVQHEFALDERNVASVVQVCHRVDGIPLALELAAARVRMLDPEPARFVFRMAASLNGLAVNAAAQDQMARALRLASVSAALRQCAGYRAPPRAWI